MDSYNEQSTRADKSLDQTPNFDESSRNVQIQDSSERTALLSKEECERRKGVPRGPAGFGARHMLAVMAFLGFVNVYCLRVNLSVALVAMVNTTGNKDNKTIVSDCPDPDGANSTASSTGEFTWGSTLQGYVLGSFFYGYIVTQLPGGWLASQFGGKKLFGYGILCTSLLTIITPFAARYSVYLFIAIRVIEGIGEGVTFPAMHAMWGSWAPVWERSKLVGFTYAGAQLGTVISLPISGVLCDSSLGWPSVFYVFGGLGALWFCVWMLVVHDTPAMHPQISVQEKEYIETSIGKKEDVETPWKAIFTSPAVLGLAVAHFSNNWGYYTLLTCLPLYMKNILKFDIKENGLLSALPYAVGMIVQMTAGFFADYTRSHGFLSTKNTRKLFNGLALGLPAIMLIIVGYVGCNHVLAIVFLTLAVGTGGFTMGGLNVNHLDIAPRFAGVLMGLTNALATIPGFVGPEVVGYLTDKKETRGQWQIVFYITAAIYVTGTIVYGILAQGEELAWAKASVKENISGKENPSVDEMEKSQS